MEILLIDKSPQVYYDFRSHSHGYWEIICNIQGEGVATIDGQDYPFREGTIFCVPPGVEHRKSASQGFIDACLFLRDFPFGEGIHCFTDDAGRTFQTLLLIAYDVQTRGDKNAKAMINALGDALYQLLAGWQSQTGQHSQPVETLRSLLAQNISNSQFDLMAALNKTGYSVSYFRKLFKSVTGHSPVGYLNYLRIEHAKRQIQQYSGIRSIKEIALASGFNDPYYFSRVFKQHAGMSPLHYAERLGHYDQQRMFDGAGPR